MIWAWENSTPKFIAPTYLGSSSLHLITLFRNKRFRLNEMFQRNASKFAMLTFIGQECEVSSWNQKRKKLLYNNKFCGISLEQFVEYKPLIYEEWLYSSLSSLMPQSLRKTPPSWALFFWHLAVIYFSQFLTVWSPFCRMRKTSSSHCTVCLR